MIKISDLCAFDFRDVLYARDYAERYDGENGCYLQKVFMSDKICVQVIDDNPDGGQAVELEAIDATRAEPYDITPLPWTYVAEYGTGASKYRVYTYFENGSALGEGVYQWRVSEDGVVKKASNPFEVLKAGECVVPTIKIEVRHADNDTIFDHVFNVNGHLVYPSLRIEGGFKSQGVVQAVEEESYRTQLQQIRHTYQFPREVEQLTIGDNGGVPMRFANVVNRFFSLDSVHVDNRNYRRSEGEVPTPVQIADDSRLYWFTLNVERDRGVDDVGYMRKTFRSHF